MAHRIKIAALNITMHQPHSAARYAKLFQQAYRMRHVVRLGKLHAALLGSLYEGEEKGRDGVVRELAGDIFRFVNLDLSQPWFNTATGEAATEKDVQEITIPKHLLPHLQHIAFIFRPHLHQLVFVAEDRSDRMGPRTAATFFERLFEHVVRELNLPPVEVTAIVDKEALDSMLGLAQLEKLTIELKRPNPDDLGGEADKWMKKLEKQRARSIVTQLTASAGKSLAPDDETKSAARVAADNGKVSVIGRDAAGDRVEESTSERPLVLTEKVDENVETVFQVLQRTQVG
jgi:hypothetical protein